MICVTRQTLEKKAMKRPPGYLQEMLSLATEKNGKLCWDAQTLLKMREKYAVGIGAGDAFALLAKPLAAALDSVLKTGLGNCGDCTERHAKWNGV
jgi:hypothetical protein